LRASILLNKLLSALVQLLDVFQNLSFFFGVLATRDQVDLLLVNLVVYLCDFVQQIVVLDNSLSSLLSLAEL